MRPLLLAALSVLPLVVVAAACADPMQIVVHESTGGSSSTGGGSTGGSFLLDAGLGADGDAGCSSGITCASRRATCGLIPDGCNGSLQCGTCTAPQTCGGGGTPSVCGGLAICTPTTCAELGANCGPVGDGCGGSLQCGTCTSPETCGGSGTASVCGDTVTCTPNTCAGLGTNCGPVGDGCGGSLECGTCTAPQTCGGGGTPSVCGAPICVPKTCAAGIDCGVIADGCGDLITCGGCDQPKTCGGAGVPSVCGIPPTCTGLCLQQVTCSGTTTTTVSGVVYAPGHAGDPAPPAVGSADPLFNMLVYVPNAPVLPFAPGVACEQCSASVSGSPLVSAFTGTDGAFVVQNVPVGQNIPLVIQSGRWRRQVVIPSVTACQDNPLPQPLTRLPRNQGEGDIPHMAFATGAVDSLECVLRKIGVDDAEVTTPSGTGRIHLYTGSGSAGASAGPGTPSETTLEASAATLKQYDMVLFPCQGGEYTKSKAAQANLIAYASAGGRVFATHYSYTWLYNDTPFSTTANWNVNQGSPADQTGYIDLSFPKGMALAQWLMNVGGSTLLGQIPIQVLRNDLTGIVAPSQSWMTITSPLVPMHYTFNTPVGAPAAQQCGRVLFDDFHVEDASNAQTGGATFPAECTAGPMTPQEKLLELMLFDLGSCITPDVPTCTPATCAELGIACGPAGDGCGNVLQCGACTAPQTCGGGGVPNACGAPTCTPATCAQLGIACGPAGDGCGGLLQCGTCPAGQTCGGGGKAGVCGSMTCVPNDCAGLGVHCGPAGDGCGGLLQCGTCPAGQSCGGGGSPGVCGGMVCTPKTCASLGANCGPVANGCGGLLQCGTCTAPATCGGAGKSNVCGGGIN